MQLENSPESGLKARSGSDWWNWLGEAAAFMPELSRAFAFLQQACALLDTQDPDLLKTRDRKLKQVVSKFFGQARCPSAPSCEKLAVRAVVFQGWLTSEQSRGVELNLLVEAGAHALQRLLVICEGADDKHGQLTKAVRGLARHWLSQLAMTVPSLIERAHLVYPVAMLDQAGLIEPAWWWKSLALCDRPTVLGLIELELRDMADMQPSSAVSWRSFDKRWRRLRLKALLEQLNETALLAELLRKSAVDDFEAASAVKLLRAAGRSRDAIVQAEQWMRALPRSAVLAEALYGLYVEDGWYDEAIDLAKEQYAYDPNPAWCQKLQALGTPGAIAALQAWGGSQ